MLSYDPKFVCSDSPGQNNWNKVEQSSKVEQEKNSLISTWAFFYCNYQSLISESDVSIQI